MERTSYDAAAADTLKRALDRVARAEAVLRSRITRLRFLLEEVQSGTPIRECDLIWGLKPPREH